MSSLVPSSMSPLVESESQLVASHEGPPQRSPSNPMAIAWRSRWLLLMCMALGAGASWLALQKVTPRYLSLSRVYVERNLPRLLEQDSPVGQTTNYLYAQAERIRSANVLAAVVDDPENVGLETFRESDNPVGFLKDALKTTVGKYDEIINVWIELPNAKEAAQIVNSVVDKYIELYAEGKRSKTLEVLKLLRGEKERRDAELEKRVKKLNDFRRQHAALAVLVDDESVVTQRFSSLSAELNSTEISLLEAKAKYNRVKKMYDAPSQRMFLLEMASSESNVHRDLDLESQVRTYEQSLTVERSKWGEGHPRVKLLRDSLTKLKKDVKKKQEAIITAYVDEARQQYELLDHKRAELQRAYDDQFKMASEVSAQVLELESLKEDVARTVKLCEILDDRIKEVNLTEDVGAMNVTIMEAAVASKLPSFPKVPQFLVVGTVLGGMVGFGMAWLRDLMDHRLKSVEDIAATLQLPVLGAIPLLHDSRERAQGGRTVLTSPRSAHAEAIRTLRTAIHFGLAGNEAKVVVVTSPSAGDGKSTVASNLAIAMAQANQRVLLLDADMRKPTQHEIFGVKAPQNGLATILAARLPIESAVVSTEVPTLDVLPCGPLPANPAELLNNGYFADLLELLRTRYDKIVVDSPPVMPVADARIIAALSDAVILVLRAERSTQRLSVAARNELWRVRVQRLGVVVNGVPLHKQGDFGYGYGYGYGYGGDHSGYVTNEPLPAGRRKKSRALPQLVEAAAKGPEISEDPAGEI
jgi:capsular exopolysaccharide synthesis family protein